MDFNSFLDDLSCKLPEICTDKDLSFYLPNFFKNAYTISRLRAQGMCPPFFSINPNFYYLRSDVISWLQERYKNQEAKPSVKPVRKMEEMNELQG